MRSVVARFLLCYANSAFLWYFRFGPYRMGIMTAKLTSEIRDALRANPGQPLPIEDAESQKIYVLIEQDEYLQLNSLQSDLLQDKDSRNRLIAQIEDGIGSGPSIPADEVFADLRRRVALLTKNA